MTATPARCRSGLTLMELLVVLFILVVLAALVVPLVGTGVSTAEIDITFQTMQRLRDAIMGGDGASAGYYADMKGLPIPGRADTYGLPYTVADLLTPNTPHFAAPGPPLFNVQTQRGWRGPYISQNNVSSSSATPVILDSFPNAGQSGSPIVIQWPPVGTANRDYYVRLVSYGANGTPGTATGTAAPVWNPALLTATNWDDDIIVYIRRDVPGMDWTNYWELKKALSN